MWLLLTSLAHATTLGELAAALSELADRSLAAPVVQADWAALSRDHGLADTPLNRAEYGRVRLAHEVFRDGGLAGVRWTITNEEPRSDAIWAQWAAGFDPVLGECDELSALFAFVGRAMGVRHLGLFWPTSNHTVAVWTADGPDGPVRVVVPTSQVFLTPTATLGDRGFDPWRQRSIYDYGRVDLPLDTELPAAMVTRVLEGARRWSTASAAELTRRRLAASGGG